MNTNSSSSYLHALFDVSSARRPSSQPLPPYRPVGLRARETSVLRLPIESRFHPFSRSGIWGLVHYSTSSSSFKDVRGLGHRTRSSLAETARERMVASEHNQRGEKCAPPTNPAHRRCHVLKPARIETHLRTLLMYVNMIRLTYLMIVEHQ